jgi:drug/metabolite transporter (DMT)-like permease
METITRAARTDRRALVAAAITVVMWASAFVAIRSAVQHYSPGALALGRLAVGALALGAILAIRREGLPPRAAWPGIVISGVLWFGVYMVALNWGEQLVDAGTAAMAISVGPVLLALLGGWLLEEGLSGRLLVGIAVSFTGAAVVGVSTSNGTDSSPFGVALCVIAAASWAAAAIAQKPALRAASALQVTTFGCAVGAVACLPFAGQLAAEAAAAPVQATLNLVYLGVFPTAVAFTTWAYALARTSAGAMGATTYAVPALVVLMAWIALGEVPAALTFAGGALCLVGVAISRYERRGSPAATAAATTATVSSGDQGDRP